MSEWNSIFFPDSTTQNRTKNYTEQKLTEYFKAIGATLVCAGIRSFVVKWLHAALGEMQGEWKMDFL